LVVIGVHTPEFSFEKQRPNVEAALGDLRVTYPVVMDSNYRIWQDFNNQYWLAFYIVDAKGRIRYEHFGEGNYGDSERAIQELLKENGATDLDWDLINNSAHGIEAPPSNDEESPESYIGYHLAERFSSPERLDHHKQRIYSAPAVLRLNHWGLSGSWNVNAESAVSQAPSGRIVFRFHSRDLHLVMAPTKDGKPVRFRVTLEGLAPGADCGTDFELRSADVQEQLLDDTVKAYTDVLKLTQNRFDGGAAPKSDVAQAQTQLDGARVQDTDITVMRAQYEHAIATLIGKPPAEFNITPAPKTALQLPVIPVGVPASLLERRPDIAAGERRVAEANNQIGIARAAFFPGTSIANWFNWPSRMWAVGPQMSQTIFDAGRRRAVSEGATANYDGTVASYRKTTLTAFQEVEDNLAALRILEKEAQQQRAATASAEESLQLFTNRYQGGVDNYLQVITAQTALLTNQRNDIDIERRRMDASVLLVKAIGGGWDASQLPRL
jgi:Thioredoxin like C-terminal domain/Outer membrane efflux protein